MIAIVFGMLIASFICHFVALNYQLRYAKTKDPLNTCSMLVFTGIGFLIMGALGCYCCRYLPDYNFYLRTKICSFGLLFFGCLAVWVGRTLRRKLTQKKPDDKQG